MSFVQAPDHETDMMTRMTLPPANPLNSLFPKVGQTPFDRFFGLLRGYSAEGWAKVSANRVRREGIRFSENGEKSGGNHLHYSMVWLGFPKRFSARVEGAGLPCGRLRHKILSTLARGWIAWATLSRMSSNV